jgi:L-lactate dehydrogenase complex protein LldE
MRTALFIPCYVEYLHPRTGLATVELLERLEVDWHYPDDQTCCGQPAVNAGHPDEALAAARHWFRRFAKADRIVSPSGSCVAMIRRYPELPGLDAGERDAFAEIGARTHELSDFLVNVLGAPPLGTRLPLRAAFQDSCHTLRELGLVDEPRRLLTEVRDLELVDTPGLECCGFGGVYSVKLPELSIVQADERLDALTAAGAQALISTDASCLLHLEGRARRRGLEFRCLHLAEVLAGAAS